MSAARHPRNWSLYWSCWWDSANSFALLLIWICFLIGYLIYPWLIFITFFQPMRLRHNWSVLWISTSWLIDRLWPVIDSPALVANNLFDFASVWNVVRKLLTLSKQCLAFGCSRLALTFVSSDLVFLSSKVYILLWVINVLVHLTLLKKLTWNCTSSNIIVDAAFFYLKLWFAF
jgi:hypothetical protein